MRLNQNMCQLLGADVGCFPRRNVAFLQYCVVTHVATLDFSWCEHASCNMVASSVGVSQKVGHGVVLL